MATRRESRGVGLEGVERFEVLSQEIEERFSHFHSLLEAQKVVLLGRVERMKELYQKHRDLDKAIAELENVRKITIQMLNENLNAGNKTEVTKMWDDKISDQERKKSELGCVSDLKFVENVDEFSQSVKHIHVRETETVEYKNRKEPVVMKGKRGGCEGDFVQATAVSVDKTTEKIYVVENLKSSVFVCSPKGEFIQSFGKEILSSPCGICVSGDAVFVSDVGATSLFKFSKTGVCVKQTVPLGKRTVQLKCPSGLCVQNDRVFLCDSGNNTITVLSKDLKFVKSFGEGILQSPQDIKFRIDKLFVLTLRDNTIHTFNTQCNFLRSISLTGQMCGMTVSAFFTIDLEGNFIISDTFGNCLKVFNQSGEYVESLGAGFLMFPQGVATENHGGIVSISKSDFNNIQIY